MQPEYTIRPARFDEISAMNELIQASSNELGKGFYTPDEIDGLNQYIFGVDKELIEDQTYFVIEKKGKLAACGGWSKRKTLFGGDQFASRIPGFLDPLKEPAKIRAFFIHPDFARQGLGTLLLEHCENQAQKAGFTHVELMSTMPGVPFYRHRGFVGDEYHFLELPNGVRVKLLPMIKKLIQL